MDKHRQAIPLNSTLSDLDETSPISLPSTSYSANYEVMNGPGLHRFNYHLPDVPNPPGSDVTGQNRPLYFPSSSNHVTRDMSSHNQAGDWKDSSMYAYRGFHNPIHNDGAIMPTRNRNWDVHAELMQYGNSKPFCPTYHPSEMYPSHRHTQYEAMAVRHNHPSSPSNAVHTNGQFIERQGISSAVSGGFQLETSVSSVTSQRYPYDWINKNSYAASQPPGR